MHTLPAICLMGPTATGKTELALELANALPLEIISVDSALVYRGMDIGTAKPDKETRARVPHRLIDIRDPEETYSAGDFVRDAAAAMNEIRAAGRLPLLVGGTMMYFRSLTAGMASLPSADAELRAAIDAEALEVGWPAMHRELRTVDPQAAARISENDSQRIQRALEVFRGSGRALTDWLADTAPAAGGAYLSIALVPRDRSVLHRRIESRFQHMLSSGFVEEVRGLMARPGLTAASPSMRAVGYRQVWAHLAGECALAAAGDRAVAATRQLAKRQLTWLRGDSSVTVFDPLESGISDAISTLLGQELDKLAR